MYPIHPKKTIVITSDEPWGDVWHTQINYAWQLSMHYNVIFIGPPRKWRMRSLFDFHQKTRNINDRLTIVEYVNPLPLSLGKWALFLDDKINELLIRRFLRSSPNNKNLLLWRFDSIRSVFLFHAHKVARQIYHVIDPKINTNCDPLLTKNAELVVVTSPRLVDDYKAIHPNVINVPQGVDLKLYSEKTASETDSSHKANGSILLLGSFTNDINFELLRDISIQFSDRHLILIGPDRLTENIKQNQFKELCSRQNVYYKGAMPPAAFQPYVDACAVGIIAYDNDRKDANKLRSPLKAISYLASEKCIVSNIDCEINSLEGKGIYHAADKSAFLELISAALVGKLLFDTQAKNRFMAAHDYQKLISIIFESLGDSWDRNSE